MPPLKPQPRIDIARLRKIGWELWDPIGLLGPNDRWDDESSSGFADEYDSYLRAAAAQLRDGTPRGQVIAYLVNIETRCMGLGMRRDTPKRAEAVVNAILADEAIWIWPDAQGRFT